MMYYDAVIQSIRDHMTRWFAVKHIVACILTLSVIYISCSEDSTVGPQPPPPPDEFYMMFDTRLVYLVGEEPYGISSGDFDRDGDVDLVTVNRESADVSVPVPSVALLLPPTGSAVDESTLAVFTIVPVADDETVPRIRTGFEAPELISPGPNDPVHGAQLFPPSNEYSALSTTEGTASVNSTPSAVDGPALLTMIV